LSAISISRPTEAAAPRGGRVRRAAAVGIAVITAGAGIAALLAQSPLFQIRTFRVAGASHLTEERVRKLAGVREGDNLLWLETHAVEQRLQEHAWVASATVERDLPSGLRISLVERRPTAAVEQGHRYRLLAGDGTTLGEAAANPQLPLIQPAASAAPGHTGPARATDGEPAPWPAARSLSVLPPRVRAIVDRVLVMEDGTLTFELRSGARVLYGQATRTREKARALSSLLRWAEEEGERIVAADVRSPSAPTARLLGVRAIP
jgi:cell division protein FtsQ